MPVKFYIKCVFSVCARLCTKLLQMIQVPGKLNFEELYLWDVIQCSPLKVNRRFGGIYCLHHNRRIRAICAYRLLSHWFLAQLVFLP
jgi:hypothetical protein